MSLPCLAIETLTDAPHQLTFAEVKATVLSAYDQDVLVTPAVLLDGVKICDLRLQSTQGAAIGLWW